MRDKVTRRCSAPYFQDVRRFRQSCICLERSRVNEPWFHQDGSRCLCCYVRATDPQVVCCLLLVACSVIQQTERIFPLSVLSLFEVFVVE
jgi:hypothetical protein